MHVERLHGSLAGRLDLGAQRRLLGKGTFELGGQQGARADELPDRRLDVHAGHVVQRAACRLEAGGHRAEPPCGRAKPISQRCEVAHQQRVDRSARVRDEGVPLVVTQLGQREPVHLQAVAQDRGIDAFVDRHRCLVEGVERCQAAVNPPRLLRCRCRAEIGQTVVEAMVTEHRREVGVSLEQLVEGLASEGREV